MINYTELDLLRQALETLARGYEDLPEFTPQFDHAAAAEVLQLVATRMQDNYPYFHPLYAGQMLKPPHAIARIAYAMSLWVNPNNHALDGGRASSALEKECVADLAAMFGWRGALGHLTGGGTMANLEALWVAGRLHPDRKIVASAQAHYTHSRISDVLGLPFEALPVNSRGELDLDSLAATMASGEVGTIVATVGNTGLGGVDPLPAIVKLARDHGARIHADAAYGGYFGLARGLSRETRAKFDVLGEVDSIVVDPHKHGLQPYGCGCVLFRDPSVGRFYQHGSPYTYFSSAELHLGEISLECSRPGAAAVALWATQQLFPLDSGGQFSRWLDDSLEAAATFAERLANSQGFRLVTPPELDIVIYAPVAPDMKSVSRLSREVFEATAREGLHLALIELPAELVKQNLPGIDLNAPTMTCLRSVLLQAEHKDWIDRIMSILESSLPA